MQATLILKVDLRSTVAGLATPAFHARAAERGLRRALRAL